MRLRSDRFTVMAALGATLALSGCANVDFDSQQAWFAKSFQLVSTKGGYSFSELQETKQAQRPITANDLVNNNGSCPPPQAAPQAVAGPGAQPGPAPAPVDTSALLGGGVALGMSECDVVFRAGAPTSVQLGNSPNGERTATLTFQSGPRAGIYRFAGGSLVEIDEVPQQPAAPKTVQKKSSKSAKTQKSNGQT